MINAEQFCSNEAKLRELGEVDVDALLASKSLREWDELFTFKIFNIPIGVAIAISTS